MPKFIKTVSRTAVSPLSRPPTVVSRTCKICKEAIPPGPCQKPICKETVRKAVEPEETKELEVKESEPPKPPAKRFKKVVLPKATGLQALMIVSQHMNNSLDEVMVNKKHEIEAFEAMDKEEQFLAAALVLHIDYERVFVENTHFDIHTEHLPESSLELNHHEVTDRMAQYFASQGYRVVVPFNSVRDPVLGDHLATVYWDKSRAPTDDLFVNHNKSWMPTGPLKDRHVLDRADGEWDEGERHDTIIEPEATVEGALCPHTLAVLSGMITVSAQVAAINPDGIPAHQPLYYIEELDEGLRVCQSFLHPFDEDVLIPGVMAMEIDMKYIAFALARVGERVAHYYEPGNYVVFNNKK